MKRVKCGDRFFGRFDDVTHAQRHRQRWWRWIFHDIVRVKERDVSVAIVVGRFGSPIPYHRSFCIRVFCSGRRRPCFRISCGFYISRFGRLYRKRSVDCQFRELSVSWQYSFGWTITVRKRTAKSGTGVSDLLMSYN